MLNLEELLKIKETITSTGPKGQYSVIGKSEARQMFRVTNHEDNSEFQIGMKKFFTRVDSGDYIQHEDGSFDMPNRKTVTFDWD